MILARSLIALAVLSSFVSAQTTISVAVNDGAFSPITVFGAINDLVVFTFNAGDESVSEATARLADPCNTEGGFDSGVQAAPGATFTIRISTTNSIYVFSSPHCTQGMVMIVNPGPNDSVAKYASVAEASGGGAPDPATSSSEAAPAPPAPSASEAAPAPSSSASVPIAPTSATPAPALVTSTLPSTLTPSLSTGGTASSISAAGSGTSGAQSSTASSASSSSAGDKNSADLSGSMIIVAGMIGALLSFF